MGQKVRRGDLVGLVGDTGNATGPHVHFEVINGDETKRRIRFRAVVNSQLNHCYIPRSGHVLQSTNFPQ